MIDFYTELNEKPIKYFLFKSLKKYLFNLLNSDVSHILNKLWIKFNLMKILKLKNTLER